MLTVGPTVPGIGTIGAGQPSAFVVGPLARFAGFLPIAWTDRGDCGLRQ